MDNSEKKQMIVRRYESEISISRANNEIPCKTCQFSEKLFSGDKLESEDFDAGSCEMYDVKPFDVYFNAKPCPKYHQKDFSL